MREGWEIVGACRWDSNVLTASRNGVYAVLVHRLLTGTDKYCGRPGSKKGFQTRMEPFVSYPWAGDGGSVLRSYSI